MRRGLALLCLLAAEAGAEPPITNREYAIDFYEGTAFGNSQMVGMGGTGLAFINGTAGTLLNASASAVRKTTDNDHWTWDWHFDYLNGQLSSDFDNNGVVFDKESGAQLFSVGLGVRVGKWSGAGTVNIQSAPIPSDDPMQKLDARNVHVRLAVARWFPDIDMAIGAGINSIAFQIRVDEQELFNISGAGLMTGATWLPRMENFRIGAVAETPIIGGQVAVSDCDPTNCMLGGRSYILPNQVVSSARFGAGGAYRWSETAWNQQFQPKFRDELAVIAAADLWITGPSKNGHGIEKFAEQQLQRSGVHTNVGGRAGVELEAIPGRLRLRAGTYWEPERFEGAGGRLHGTFGVEVRVFEFQAWGLRRGRTGITTDFASRYRNIGVSLGLWH